MHFTTKASPALAFSNFAQFVSQFVLTAFEFVPTCSPAMTDVDDPFEGFADEYACIRIRLSRIACKSFLQLLRHKLNHAEMCVRLHQS